MMSTESTDPTNCGGIKRSDFLGKPINSNQFVKQNKLIQIVNRNALITIN